MLISNSFSRSLNNVPNIMFLFLLFSNYLIAWMLKTGIFVTVDYCNIVLENSMWTLWQGGN